jgi:hypothetical protein
MTLAISNEGTQEHGASHLSVEQSLGDLSKHLAHDFNNIWATIFGLTQQLSELPGQQIRDQVIDRINVASSYGLLYSRSVMGVLRKPDLSAVSEFDLCAAVREWTYRTSDQLANSIDLSCLVPPDPLTVKFNKNALHLILLAFVGYALRSNEPKRWAMIGVRSSGEGKQAQSVPQDCLDLMFLCRLADYRGQPPDHFQKRVNAIRTLAARHAGVVETWVVPQVGVNLRIRLPVAAAPTAGQAGSM